MTRGYLIGENFRDRIERTIERVAGTPYGGGVTNVTPRLETITTTRREVRIGAVPADDGAWQYGTYKDILVIESGGGGSTDTFNALNRCITIVPGDYSVRVVCVRVLNEWHFVAVGDMRNLRGFDFSAQKVLAYTPSDGLCWKELVFNPIQNAGGQVVGGEIGLA